MLLIMAAILLAAWLVGVSLFETGQVIHVLLLIGLLLGLLGFLKARDAGTSAGRAHRAPDGK